MEVRKWMASPPGVVSLVGAAVFVAELALMLLMRRVFAPLLHVDVAHGAWDLMGAVLLTLAVAPALYWLVFHKLRASEIRFRQIAAAMIDAMVVTDRQARIVEWNPAAERLFQYSRQEALGQPLHKMIVRSSWHAEVEHNFPHFAKTGECPHSGKLVDILARRKDGSEFPAELSTSSARWGNHWHAIGVVRDLSERRSLEQAIEESDRQLRLTTEMAGIATWNYNFRSGQMFRTRNHDQLYGLAWQDRWDMDTMLQATHPDDRARSRESILASVAAGGSDNYSFDFRVVWPDGSVHWLWVQGQVRERDATGRGVLVHGVLLDVTTRKDAEAKILRQAQLYDALSRCSEAIVRCASERDLFAEICRIAVGTGGMKLAWIGLIDPDTRLLRPVASAGEHVDDYLRGIEISVAADSPYGHGPVGLSVQEGRPTWFADFQRDPRAAPWHQRAARLGLGAVASLPLRQNGAVLGTLALYGASTESFDEATRSLLEQMAGDISFALDNFAHEAVRRQAQAELHESEQRYRSLVEQSIAGVYVIQVNKLIYVNPYIADMLGYADAGELIGRDPLCIVAEKSRGTVAENIRLRLEGKVDRIHYNFTALCKDGRTLEVSANGARALYRGRPAIVGMMQDITEEVRIEALREQHLVQLESAFMGTVQVATQLFELRDHYTHGHASRVGMIAAAIGAELGLDEKRQQGLRVAGNLHDIGKISISLEILTKPEPLTAAEWRLIHMHPQVGYDLLKGIDLPWPVAEVAWQHHERMDGSGYPRGLRGDEIILEARIVMVADVVESMASRRPYRHGLGIDRALEEIERGSGRLYDPVAVDACLRLFREHAYVVPD